MDLGIERAKPGNLIVKIRILNIKTALQTLMQRKPDRRCSTDELALSMRNNVQLLQIKMHPASPPKTQDVHSLQLKMKLYKSFYPALGKINTGSRAFPTLRRDSAWQQCTTMHVHRARGAFQRSIFTLM